MSNLWEDLTKARSNNSLITILWPLKTQGWKPVSRDLGLWAAALSYKISLCFSTGQWWSLGDARKHYQNFLVWGGLLWLLWFLLFVWIFFCLFVLFYFFIFLLQIKWNLFSLEYSFQFFLFKICFGILITRAKENCKVIQFAWDRIIFRGHQMNESSQTEVFLCYRALMQSFDANRVPD